MFDPQIWAAVPFNFWLVVFFVFGCIVGSFLNVCIHRLPRGESIVSPPSHCPCCDYHIPWYLNIPLFTWIFLRGQCAHCGAPISIRYFLVELLTGLVFMACCFCFGASAPLLALAYCFLLAGFIVATFVDIEHMIIPDSITMGGIAAGFLCSFVVPALHGTSHLARSLEQSALGTLVGLGVMYAILRGANVFLGRHKIMLKPDTKVIFDETSLRLPDEEIPYEELFYRKSDSIQLQGKSILLDKRRFMLRVKRMKHGTQLRAKSVSLESRRLENVPLTLTPACLQLGAETLNPEDVPRMEVVTDQIVLPREAMGLGDVLFMGAIGSFLGWKAVFFSLMLSCFIGAAMGSILIVLGGKQWSSRIPYGPYIAMAATVWIFWGQKLLSWWLAFVGGFAPRL